MLMSLLRFSRHTTSLQSITCNAKSLSLWCAALLSGAVFSANIAAGEFNAVMSIGDPMPNFTELPDTEGDTLSANDIDHKVVVLVSLANHCPWVQGMDYALVELANKYKKDDVRFVGFSVSHREEDKLTAMKQHAKKTRYPFTYVYDASQALGRALGATKTPEYFVFNAERKLVYMGAIHNSPAKKSGWRVMHTNGKPSDFYVDDAIQATLNGQAAPTAETKAHGCTVKYLDESDTKINHADTNTNDTNTNDTNTNDSKVDELTAKPSADDKDPERTSERRFLVPENHAETDNKKADSNSSDKTSDSKADAKAILDKHAGDNAEPSATKPTVTTSQSLTADNSDADVNKATVIKKALPVKITTRDESMPLAELKPKVPTTEKVETSPTGEATEKPQAPSEAIEAAKEMPQQGSESDTTLIEPTVRPYDAQQIREATSRFRRHLLEETAPAETSAP